MALEARPARGRGLFKLGLGIAALLFCLSIGISAVQIITQSRLEVRIQRSSQWLSTQALVELAQFDAVLSRYRSGAATSAQMWRQFEILYSRVLVLDGPENSPEYAQIRDLQRSVPELLKQLDWLEDALRRMDGNDPVVLARVNEVLDTMGSHLRDTNVAMHRERQVLADHAVSGLRSLYWVFLACTIGLLASTGLLVALLLAESRRARRLLGQAEEAAARQTAAERTLRALIDSLPAMVCAFDSEGRYLFMNDAYARFHRLREGKAIGHRPRDLGLEDGSAASLREALAAEGPLPFAECRVRDLLGAERTLLNTAVAVADETGARRRVVAISLDITDRKAVEDRVRHLAEHDTLTDLPNRMLFTSRLRAALDRAKAGGPGFALHCIDLDRFKDINDSQGHPVGDQLLLAAAERMRNCLRLGDTLARIGGDEFAVIQAEVPTAQEAERLAQRLVRVMEEPFRIGSGFLRSGVSIGSALGLAHGRLHEQLMQRADIALYRAKAEGRGRAILFEPEMEAVQMEERLLVAELGVALEGRGLDLAFQPKFRLSDGQPIGCEALARWQHPVRGAIPPGRFVPMAEEAGKAGALARYVLREACAQAWDWHRRSLRIPVAVNLSATLFADARAVELVREALEESGLPPHLLEIELTESIFIRNAGMARQVLMGLRALGVRTALDDFGTGYSSLGYLQHLNFDVLKIDRTFVEGLRAAVPGSGSIVEAILRLARALGAEVVAEGVETAEQMEMLRDLGCDAVQGYLFGRPMPAEALALLFRVAPPPALAQPAASCP